LKPKSKKSQDLLLFKHEGQNPFSGAYTNAIYARRRANGRFTVWVKAWSMDGSAEDCWQKDLASAPEFVAACQTCLEFVEFGEADVVDVVRGGFEGLRKLDLSFADTLRTALLEQFSEDCAVAPVAPPEISGGNVTVTRLSNKEARKKYGSSMTFIRGTSTDSNEDESNPV
jgi:hypothetical protein